MADEGFSASASIALSKMSRMPSPSWRNRSITVSTAISSLSFAPEPAQSNAERDEIGAHGGRRLRPDPPSGAVVAAMALRVGGCKRGLADATQSVQRRDGDATLVALERRFDRRERIVATHEMLERGSECSTPRRLCQETRPSRAAGA